jgi:hypothetical protein
MVSLDVNRRVHKDAQGFEEPLEAVPSARSSRLTATTAAMEAEEAGQWASKLQKYIDEASVEAPAFGSRQRGIVQEIEEAHEVQVEAGKHINVP